MRLDRIHQQSNRSRSEFLPAVFLDRDGTIIEDIGVLDEVEDIRLFPDAIVSLRKLQKKYLLFVITNQPGVARGWLSMDQVNEVNNHLNALLLREGVAIREWYVCPHKREDNCSCIKPKPEFVLQAQKDYGLDLKKSFIIGDHPHDTLTANDEGLSGLYLLTGHGVKHLSQLPAGKPVFQCLSEAVEWIMNHPVQPND